MEIFTLSDIKNLTSNEEEALEGCFDDSKRAFKFNSKPIIVISSWVHPGESPAAHILEGMIDFLLDETNP